jgi:hypothetical protein
MIPGLWGQTSAGQTSAADNFPQRPGPSRSVGGFTPSRYSWTVRADQPGSPCSSLWVPNIGTHRLGNMIRVVTCAFP